MGIDFEGLDKRLQSVFQRLDDNLNIFENLQKRTESARHEFEKASEALKALESEMKAVLADHEKQFAGLTHELDTYTKDIHRLRDMLLSVQKELLAFADKRIGDHLEGINARLGDISRAIYDLEGKIGELDSSSAGLREDVDHDRRRLECMEKRLRLAGAFAFIALAVSFISAAIFLLSGR